MLNLTEIPALDLFFYLGKKGVGRHFQILVGLFYKFSFLGTGSVWKSWLKSSRYFFVTHQEVLFFNNQKLTSISFIIFFIWMKLFWTISKNCWTPELGQNWEFHLFPLFLFAQETMSAPTFFLRLLFPPLAYFFLSSFNTFRFLCFYQSGIAVSVFSTMNVFSCPSSSILGGEV